MNALRPLLGCLLVALPAAAEPATDFIRFVETPAGAALQTAVARYAADSGATVDLVGAVHMADRAYFDALNRRFLGYDAVLYELVGRPVEARETLQPGDGAARLRWLGQAQETMRRALALESQLQGIDYRAGNFVHADLSVAGFFAAQQQKQESFFSLWLRAVQAQQALPESRPLPGLVQILEILTRKDSATELKRLLGREFDRVEQLITGFEAGGGTAIIGERNRHALGVLERELARGHRRLAIFYGAAHLPDFERRLAALGFRRQGLDWLTAWDLPPPAP